MRILHNLTTGLFGGMAILAAILLPTTPAFAGGAIQTCDQWIANGTGPSGDRNSVSAQCRKINGQWNRSTAWLPGCVANWNGQLGWARDGFFDRSCRECRVVPRGTTVDFTCKCRRTDGSEATAAIDLNGLSNWDGTLACPN